MTHTKRRHTLYIYTALLLFCLSCTAKIQGQPFDPSTAVQASRLSKESKFYLVNCEPGEIIYERFGHSGIRLVDPNLMIDVVYHYGVFDYLQPHFVARFVSGVTDYSIGCWPWELFLYDYHDRHSSVIIQELNLTDEEKNRLFHALEENNKPENRLYRYNFVYDNCATRPFNMVMKTLNKQIVVAPNTDTINGIEIIENIRNTEGQTPTHTHNGEIATFRNVIEEHLGSNTWWKFAIDIVLGKEADQQIGWQQLLAFPKHQSEILSQINIIDSSTSESKPLVKSTTEALSYPPVALPNNGIFNPIAICALWLIFVVTITLYEWRKRTYHIWLDIAQLLFFGFFGCIIFYLMFFSYHPLVESNYNLLWLNPLQILFAFIICKRSWRKKSIIYMWFNIVTVTIGIFFWAFGPQVMHPAFLLLMIAMMIRSLYFTIYHTKQS
ncbi:MAG: DUF4105 domain-containing protein [Bacteroidales bacterium]|nr:DUF4105 domain-containing protein [Bacteroidales bacterium]